MTPTITTFAWVPPFARGQVRDLRARWAFEEIGAPYALDLIRDAKTPEHRRFQPFGQVPCYRDEDVALFESGAIVLHIARRGTGLLPDDAAGRAIAEQWVIAALNSVEPFVMNLVRCDLFEADKP
jgi:glutathione S-transferase